jgi:hypothetical protein
MDACTRPVAPRPITLGCTLVQACPHHRTLWFHAARTSPAPPPQNPSTTFPFLGVPSGALETHVNLPTSQGRGIPSKWTPSILCHLQEVVPFSACHPVMCSVVGALTCGCRPSSPAHTHTHTHTHAQTGPPSLHWPMRVYTQAPTLTLAQVPPLHSPPQSCVPAAGFSVQVVGVWGCQARVVGLGLGLGLG